MFVPSLSWQMLGCSSIRSGTTQDRRASDRVSERGRLAGALRQRADRHPHHPAKNKLFLCLSRACLAKMINFGIQVAQGRRFPAPRCFHLPSRRHRRRRLLAWRLAAVAARPPFHSSAAGRGRSCCSLLSGSAPAASAARRSSPDHPPNICGETQPHSCC